MIMTATKKLLRTRFLLLCIVMAGVQNAHATSAVFYSLKYTDVVKENLTFDLYHCSWVNDYYETELYDSYVAVLKGISGNNDEVTVPAAVEHNGSTYYVKGIDGQVTNNSVYKLTFEGDVNFHMLLPRVSITGETVYTLLGSLDLPYLHKLVFKGDVVNMNYNYSHRLNCVNLEEIYFLNSNLPGFTRYWSDYCIAPASGITAYVANKTADEIASLKQYPIWIEFKDVVLYMPEPEGVDVNIYVTVEEDNPAEGVMFRIDDDRYISGSGSKVFKTMIHNSLTFYVADGSMATPGQVFVNGKDVLLLMTEPESNPFYNSADPKEYTISDVAGDTYIRVKAAGTVDHYTVSAGKGGTVAFDLNGNQMVTGGQSRAFTLNKGESKALAISPMDGYEFDGLWWNGMDVTSTATFEQLDDSTLVTTIQGGGEHMVTFKPAPKQLFTRVGGDGMVKFTKKVKGRSYTYTLADGQPRWVPLSEWKDGDHYTISIELKDGESMKVLRDGRDVTWMFELSPLAVNRTYVFNVDDPECTELFLEEDINVWEEAGWYIEISKETRTFFVNTTGVDYVDVTFDGRSYQFNGNGATRKYEVPAGCSFVVQPFTNRSAIKAVKLNGEDVTKDSRYFVESGSTGTAAGSYEKYDFGSVTGDAMVQIVYQSSQYDTNSDGSVTIADVTKLVNVILGKE